MRPFLYDTFGDQYISVRLEECHKLFRTVFDYLVIEQDIYAEADATYLAVFKKTRPALVPPVSHK